MHSQAPPDLQPAHAAGEIHGMWRSATNQCRRTCAPTMPSYQRARQVHTYDYSDEWLNL